MEEENKDKIQINLDKNQGEVIIRHGEAGPPVVPRRVDISGRVTAQGVYGLERKEQIDPSSCNVIIDRDDMSIKLVIEEKKEDSTIIRGQLTHDKFFASFNINADHQWSLTSLANHLKMHKYYFSDKDAGAKVISELKQFKGKIATTMEEASDDRGAMKSLLEKQLDSNVPMSFDLNMPIFKGQNKHSFKVEIAIELRDAAVAVSLVSPEVSEIIQDVSDKILDGELKNFSDYAILEV